MLEYIKADASRADAMAGLAALLWSDHDADELAKAFSKTIQSDACAIFLCIEDGVEIGFAEFALRYDYVEGTAERPVGYLEGIYVREPYRNRGIAKALIGLGEEWAKGKGCRQMASDCELGNAGSLKFHLSSGFREANRIICFVKDITI